MQRAAGPPPGQPPAGDLLDPLIERFLRRVGRKGSQRTEENYGWGLTHLRRFLAARGVDQLDELDEEGLEEFQQDLLERGWTPRSRSLAHTAVRSFLRWLLERELIDWRLLRAVDPVKVPKGRARPIPRDDLAAIMAHLGPRRRDATLRELRDRALFHYLLTSSARISEALQVQRDDYAAAVITKKGGDPRALRIPPTVRAMIDDYLAARRDDCPWLWIMLELGRPPRLLGRHSANRAWGRLARQLGVRSWSSHRLRDTGATYLTREGVPSLVVSDWLGHDDPGSTQKYVEIVDEERLDVVERMEQLVRRPPAPTYRQGVAAIRRSRPDRRSATIGAAENRRR